MEKIKFSIKTISKVIISPRASQGLYKGIDFSKDEEFSVIYPFYSYSDRYDTTEKYDELKKKVEYYIPASSLKGALHIEDKKIARRVYCNDMVVESEDIQLGNIFKFQYIDSGDKEIKYEEFMDNIGIEMIDNNKGIEGEIFLKDLSKEYFIKEILGEAHKRTIKNLGNLKKEICNKNKTKKLPKYEIIIDNLDEILGEIGIENKYLLFLGGYKGIISSISPKYYRQDSEQKRALYFDTRDHAKVEENNPYLPYGLVELKLKNE